VDTGSREENASKQKDRAPFRFNRNGKGSSTFWKASGCRKRDERYLIVTCIVITDVPEAFCPLPVAVMAKASLPLYLAFAVYW
jgi:hypothetical protein